MAQEVVGRFDPSCRVTTMCSCGDHYWCRDMIKMPWRLY